jgi:pilus assembly protein Flp/PilA
MNALFVTMLLFAGDMKDRLRKDKGATAVEYGLLIGLVGVALVAVIIAFRDQIAGVFSGANKALQSTAAKTN